MGATLSEIRERIKTALTGVTGGGYTLNADRIVLGRDVMAEANTFLSGLAAGGPYLSIRPGAKTGEDRVSQSDKTYSIPARLYIGIPKGTDYDFTDAEDLLSAMDAALDDVLTWDVPTVDIQQDVAVVTYELTFEAEGC